MLPPIVYQATRLPWPTPWAEIFGRPAPLLLEIGFGGGHFLVGLAQKRPDANVLGVEISLPSLRRGQKKIEQAELGNVRLVQADARLLLQALCAPATLSSVYINFPDPWPKARHQHRRLISQSFLHLAATRLTIAAHLDIATDHVEYAAAIAQCLAQTPYFDSRQAAPFATEDDERPRTKYERTALAEGRICHYFKWQRNDTPAPNIFPVPKEHPMPHVVLRSPLSLAEIGRRLPPDPVAAGNTHASYLEAYHSLSEAKLLIGAYVKEEPLSQRVGLAIRQREPGEFVISLHEVGFPRPTAGIHLAIAHLAEWIIDLHSASQLIHTNLRQEIERKT